MKETEELEKQVNILILSSYNIIEQIDNFEFKYNLKMKVKEEVNKMLKQAKNAQKHLEKLNDELCEVGKEDNPAQYRKALNEMPKFSQRLDVAINKIYKNGK